MTIHFTIHWWMAPLLWTIALYVWAFGLEWMIHAFGGTGYRTPLALLAATVLSAIAWLLWWWLA